MRAGFTLLAISHGLFCSAGILPAEVSRWHGLSACARLHLSLFPPFTSCNAAGDEKVPIFLFKSQMCGDIPVQRPNVWRYQFSKAKCMAISLFKTKCMIWNGGWIFRDTPR